MRQNRPMISLLLAIAPVAYGFAPGIKLDYLMTAEFDGFIPVLGGQQGKVQIDLAVGVEGLEPKDSRLRAASELKKFKIVFNGGELPLGLEEVKDYFPRTTIEISPMGEVLKTDAPNVNLPVRLPGLDARRFPEISYLPVQFPAGDLTQGQTWEFKKGFGGSDVTYKCLAAKVDDATVEVEMDLDQSYLVMENEAKEIVTDKKDAIASVKTDLRGSGRVIFDRKRGVVLAFSANATSISVATDLKTKKDTRRELATKLNVKLKVQDKQVQGPTSLLGMAQDWWKRTVDTGADMWSKAKGYWFAARSALAAALSAAGIPWLAK